MVQGTCAISGILIIRKHKMSEMLFKLTASTNVGCVRTNNEDNFIVNENLSSGNWFVPSDLSKTISLGESGAILVVADGMGGMNAGEVASAIAIDTIKSVFSLDDYSKIIVSDKKIEAFLKDAIIDADTKIKAKVKEDDSTSGMGTTIVIAWILKDVAHIAWCGDSRAYLFNPSSGLVRLSKDHSYVQELVDAGKLDPELAFDHPNSNIITRSLGDSPAKARPDYVSRVLTEGDSILLCSDGLCGLCRDEEIAQIMIDAEDIENCKNNLIKAALEAGGYDNVTVALFEVDSIDSEEVVVTDTTNDLKTVKNRKRRSRRLTSLIVILVLAALVGGLYYTGNLKPVLRYVKDKLEYLLDESPKSQNSSEIGMLNMENAKDTSDVAPVDSINI